MDNFFTQEQLSVLDQSIRGKTIKVEILNLDYKIIDVIEGRCENGEINIDANSDNRRSFDLTLSVASQYTELIEKKYIVGKNNLIWMDKYVKIM